MATLFLEFNDEYLRDVLSTLISEGGKVDYLSTSAPNLYTKPIFKHTNIVLESNFNFPEKILELNYTNHQSLSKEDILSNLDIEKVYLSITDRLCFYPKTVQFRQQLYYELLLYWKNFLMTNEITHVVYPRVPHLGYGNIVFLLSKKLGIKTILIRDIPVDGLTKIETEFMNPKKVPVTFGSNLSQDKILKKLLPTLRDSLNGQSGLATLNSSFNSATLSQNNQGFKSAVDPKTINALISLIHRPWEQYHPSVFNFESRRTWLDYYVSLIHYYWSNRKLWNIYKSLASDVEVSKKYLYLALHYQPEKTSLPEGGVFENQLLMVDILSKSLPKGWFLYVKEHPYQFSRSDTRQTNFRDRWYYEKIASYRNVKLVSIDVPVDKLISKCVAAVTLTGNTGWEALRIGKPVITFSSAAWYLACRSCYLVGSGEEVVAAIKQIKSIRTDKVHNDLLKFLLFVQKSYISSSSESYSLKHLSAKRAELISELVKGLVVFLTA